MTCEENTLIFFIGDNGAPLKIQKVDAPGGGAGWDGSLNEPLNGEKGMLSKGGTETDKDESLRRGSPKPAVHGNDLARDETGGG